MADAIFNDALETTGKCANLALSAIITDNDIFFNGTVTDDCDKGSTRSGEAINIHIYLCTD